MTAAALERPCPSCGRDVEESDADEYGWCEECRRQLRKSARRGAHLVAVLVTVPFAAWIVVQNVLEGRQLFQVLPFYAWLLPLAVAYYLGLRIGRELIRGYRRWKRSQPGAPGAAASQAQEHEHTGEQDGP